MTDESVTKTQGRTVDHEEWVVREPDRYHDHYPELTRGDRGVER